MVLFHNINVGQRVELDLGLTMCRGIVRYKGSLATKQGDWVGVHLDQPLGNCDGMVWGRRYFQCPDHHGVFVRANHIRFIPIQRRLYNKYHRTSRKSFVDERLFGSSAEFTEEPLVISTDYHQQLTSGRSLDDNDLFNVKHYPLCHSISRTRPAATMRRPRSVALTYSSRPIHTEYDIENEFISSPSIPKTHMPYSALRNQVKRGWENTHYVREMSVGTGRDSMKFSQWNDISS